MVRLAPGVDTEAFRPGAGGAEIRERLGLGQRPVVVCVSRMVPRKGQDTLIRAWPQVLAAAAQIEPPAPVTLAPAQHGTGKHARPSAPVSARPDTSGMVAAPVELGPAELASGQLAPAELVPGQLVPGQPAADQSAADQRESGRPRHTGASGAGAGG